jgi:excisionase family DNA binding protein
MIRAARHCPELGLKCLPGWMTERANRLGATETNSPEKTIVGTPGLLTVSEAAALLRVSARTVRRHIAQGKILTFVSGGRSGFRGRPWWMGGFD